MYAYLDIYIYIYTYCIYIYGISLYIGYHYIYIYVQYTRRQEYRLICEGLGRTVEQAIDVQSFLRLVNEDREPGSP